MELVIPPEKFRGLLYHWLVSERSSYAVINHWNGISWYIHSEKEAISCEELGYRGWKYWGPVDIPVKLLIDAPYMLEQFLQDEGLK